MVANKDDEQQQQQQDTTATSTTINNENNNDLATSSLFCYGGDFAGLSATFSATTGHVIAVPEYMVPDVMLEWGQQPVALEVLVSEDFEFGSDDDDDAATQQPEETTTASTSTSFASSTTSITTKTTMTRHTVTIVPEVGCGIDNLDTMKSVYVMDMSNNLDVFGKNNGSVVALHYPLLPLSTTTSRTTTTATVTPTTRVETTFRLIDNKHRMRVMVDVLFDQQHGTGPNSIIIKTPIVLVLERRISKTSTSGTIANDGGLDARTVSSLLGETLSKGQPFAEDDPVTWDSDVMDDDDETMSLKFPGNITVSYKTYDNDTSSSSLVLKVGHVVNNGRSRHVVTRRFNKDGTLEDIDYSTETKSR